MIGYARYFEFGTVNCQPILDFDADRWLSSRVQTSEPKTVTRGQQLAEHHYPGDLAERVREMRAAGASWRVIAVFVNPKFGRRASVTHESLRQWYGGTESNL